jgi:tetratricopeptide (TPR) repeat protein
MPEKAIEAYDYALVINDQNSFAIFNKANILYNLERYADAIPVYLEYLEFEDDSVEALTYLAECYEKADEITLARKYYHDALELAPEYADPWFGLGVIELNSGNIDDSLIYFRKAVKLDDENPEFWYLLGKAHYARDEKKAALRCFREALKLDPYYGEVWSVLGLIIMKENLVSRAIPYLRHAYKVTGDVPGINFILAAFYLRTASPEEALKHLQLAIGQDKELYKEFIDLYTSDILTPGVIRLLEKNNLI